MNSKTTISLMLAFTLSLLLIPTARADVYGNTAAPAYIELDATQLDQLVAPIALDPDPLVAQILTASTYPDQVSAADTWLNQNMNQPPDQRASGANNMSWDPAVKGLIEFPAVLDLLAKNNAWTAQLGNAYYNQPGDVMNAIQAMRLQAQQSNVLVTTAQQRVVVTAGVIDIVPVDPAVIYVPYYNPWRIWGTLFVAYPGFFVPPPPVGVVWATGLAFDPGVAIGVYAGFGWGFDAWAPVWDGGVVAFGGDTYISNSTTVINHGYFGGHDRGVFDHDGRGVPHGYHACTHAGTARARAASARAHAGSGFGKPNAGHPFGGHGMGNSHSSPFANRGTNANHGTMASRGNAGASRANANANRSGANHGSTTAANRGAANGYHGANPSRAGSANRTSGNYGAANHGSGFGSGNRGTNTSAANHGTANRGMANRGSATANRGGSAAANRGPATANRGGAGMNRGGSMANRSAGPANHGNSMANRSSGMGNRGAGSPMSNRGSSMGNRGGAGSSMANRGGAGMSHGSGMASRGGSGGGHASGAGRSGGRGR